MRVLVVISFDKLIFYAYPWELLESERLKWYWIGSDVLMVDTEGSYF